MPNGGGCQFAIGHSHGAGERYGQHWEKGDVVGCGIELTEGKINFTFYLNGVSMCEAWTDCAYAGHGLYPVCEIGYPRQRNKMVFAMERLLYLPKKEGFKPLYASVFGY